MVSAYDEHNDGHGRIILWITFGLMAGSAIGFAILGSTKSWKYRAHAVCSTAIVTIAASAYYALAINRGNTPILVGDGSGNRTRDIFYARYIDWTFTTPLLILDVLLIAAVPFGTVLWVVFCDILMIILGLFGAITVGKYKWGWYGAACFFQLLITYGLLVSGSKYVRQRRNELTWYYTLFAGYLTITWLGYPIVWGLAEGANVITSQAEAGSYAGLDIATKVIFGWALMLSLKSLHKVQDKEEAETPYYVSALDTSCNSVWGNAGPGVNRRSREKPSKQTEGLNTAQTTAAV